MLEALRRRVGRFGEVGFGGRLARFREVPIERRLPLHRARFVRTLDHKYVND
jgi:hypothetical protein